MATFKLNRAHSASRASRHSAAAPPPRHAAPSLRRPWAVLSSLGLALFMAACSIDDSRLDPVGCEADETVCPEGFFCGPGGFCYQNPPSFDVSPVDADAGETDAAEDTGAGDVAVDTERDPTVDGEGDAPGVDADVADLLDAADLGPDTQEDTGTEPDALEEPDTGQDEPPIDRDDAGPDAAPTTVPSRLTEGLVAYYRFDEGEGETVVDSSPPTPTAPLELDSGSLAWTAGRNGVSLYEPAVLSSGTTAVAKILDAVVASDAVSLEIWARPADLTGSGTIVGLADSSADVYLAVAQSEDDLTVRLDTDHGSTHSDGTPTLEVADALSAQPTHIVITYTADGMLMVYIDGSMAESESRNGGLANWTDSRPLTVGALASEDEPWTGQIYLLAVYDQVLTSGEVADNFDAGSNPALAGTAVDDTAPTAPTAILLDGTTESSVLLSWSSADDDVAVAGYEVVRDDVLIGTAAGESFRDLTVAPDTTYGYVVHAYDRAGNLSEASGELVVGGE